MAKTEALEWNSFFKGEIKAKHNAKSGRTYLLKAVEIGAIATVLGLTLAHTVPILATTLVGAKITVTSAVTSGNAVAVMASVASDPTFQAQIANATKPIKDVIFGFANEIYFVFMAWGALEALIGKPQQGFSRMKTATGAYILLYWVPWIVKQVGRVAQPF